MTKVCFPCPGSPDEVKSLFLDARSLKAGTELHTTVCIVGAGAAGITLASALQSKGLDVVLLESGGLEYDQRNQDLARGISTGLPYHALQAMRLRYFGGTTNHWAGWCRPPTGEEFAAREWIPFSGWPFPRTRLDPYYRRAHEILELGRYSYDPAFWSSDPNERIFPTDGAQLRTAVTQFSPPVRFGKKFRDSLRRAQRVTVCLHANATEIETNDSATRVTRACVKTLDGNRVYVRARHFVLASGGIENARLLLVSNRHQPAGLGNRHDLVGRFFMDHVKFEIGRILPVRNAPAPGFYQQHHVQGIPIKGKLRFNQKTLADERMLDCYFELEPSGPWNDDSHARELAGVLEDLGPHANPRADDPPLRSWRVVLRLDPAPNPDSRVTLAPEQDALGMPRVALHWQYGTLEKRTFDRAQQLLAREIGRFGVGRMRIERFKAEDRWPPPPSIGVPTGFHHMGTTRMHDDPRQGVVNADCRVHGVANLFVAGTGVSLSRLSHADDRGARAAPGGPSGDPAPMTHGHALGRRRLLEALLLAPLLSFGDDQGDGTRNTYEGAVKIRDLFRGLGNARAIGNLFLETQSPGATLAGVYDQLARSLLLHSAPRPPGAGPLRTRILKQIERDFMTGNTVEIEGWVLAATELHVCALVALLP
jgi:choline dehydrogenase-like flavoprotein